LRMPPRLGVSAVAAPAASTKAAETHINVRPVPMFFPPLMAADGSYCFDA
jgi:hypothetical protein